MRSSRSSSGKRRKIADDPRGESRIAAFLHHQVCHGIESEDGIIAAVLSRLSGVNIETIRYYERIKMLQVPPRTASGRRVYGATELRVLAFIRRSRKLGFSLDENGALLRLGAPGLAHAVRSRKLLLTVSKTLERNSRT